LELVGGGDYPEIMCERRTGRAEGQDAVGTQQKREAGVRKRQRSRDEKRQVENQGRTSEKLRTDSFLSQCG